MSANPRRKRTAKATQPAVSRGGTPLESQIRDEVIVRVKRRLGLAERDRVPVEVQALVDSAAREVAESSIALAVMREVAGAAERLARRSAHEAGPEAAAVADFSDLPLLREAEYLAAKKKALQAAGFSSDDAMRILVAEVTGGSPRR
jgi:hypothetical protein